MIIDKEDELAKKAGIDIVRLKNEQLKIAKSVSLIDSMDFSSASSFGSFSNIIVGNKILSAVVVIDSRGEVLEEKFYLDNVSFPYLPSLRSYRELPAMIKALSLLEHKPDLLVIDGLGINHSRLGLATHFSINTSIPSIGVSDTDLGFTIKSEKFFLSNREVGRVLQSKAGSRPLFISPGSGISISTSAKIISSMIHPPHKLPLVMKLARKYAKKVAKEVFEKS